MRWKLWFYVYLIMLGNRGVTSTSCSWIRTSHLADNSRKLTGTSCSSIWTSHLADNSNQLKGTSCSWMRTSHLAVNRMNWQAQAVLGCELVTWPLTEANCICENRLKLTWHDCKGLKLTRLLKFEIDMIVEVWNWHGSRSLKLTYEILTEINIGIENAMCIL